MIESCVMGGSGGGLAFRNAALRLDFCPKRKNLHDILHRRRYFFVYERVLDGRSVQYHGSYRKKTKRMMQNCFIPDVSAFMIRKVAAGASPQEKVFPTPLTNGALLHTQKESSPFTFRSVPCPQPFSPCPSPVSGGGVSFLQGEDAVLTSE